MEVIKMAKNDKDSQAIRLTPEERAKIAEEIKAELKAEALQEAIQEAEQQKEQNTDANTDANTAANTDANKAEEQTDANKEPNTEPETRTSQNKKEPIFFTKNAKVSKLLVAVTLLSVIAAGTAHHLATREHTDTQVIEQVKADEKISFSDYNDAATSFEANLGKVNPDFKTTGRKDDKPLGSYYIIPASKVNSTTEARQEALYKPIDANVKAMNKFLDVQNEYLTAVDRPYNAEAVKLEKLQKQLSSAISNNDKETQTKLTKELETLRTTDETDLPFTYMNKQGYDLSLQEMWSIAPKGKSGYTLNLVKLNEGTEQ